MAAFKLRARSITNLREVLAAEEIADPTPSLPCNCPLYHTGAGEVGSRGRSPLPPLIAPSPSKKQVLLAVRPPSDEYDFDQQQQPPHHHQQHQSSTWHVHRLSTPETEADTQTALSLSRHTGRQVAIREEPLSLGNISGLTGRGGVGVGEGPLDTEVDALCSHWLIRVTPLPLITPPSQP